jgi:hypothetical protein
MFDRKSQFDRSFFDRTYSTGPPLPARIAGRYTVATRTAGFTKTLRTNEFTVVERPGNFTVVSYK